MRGGQLRCRRLAAAGSWLAGGTAPWQAHTLPLEPCMAVMTGMLMLVTVDSREPATPASGDGTSARPVLYTEAASP